MKPSTIFWNTVYILFTAALVYGWYFSITTGNTAKWNILNLPDCWPIVSIPTFAFSVLWVAITVSRYLNPLLSMADKEYESAQKAVNKYRKTQ